MKTLREITLYSHKYKYISFCFLTITPDDFLKKQSQVLNSVHYELLKYQLISFSYIGTLLI
jgi:hypothetical protein